MFSFNSSLELNITEEMTRSKCCERYLTDFFRATNTTNNYKKALPESRDRTT